MKKKALQACCIAFLVLGIAPKTIAGDDHRATSNAPTASRQRYGNFTNTVSNLTDKEYFPFATCWISTDDYITPLGAQLNLARAHLTAVLADPDGQLSASERQEIQLAIESIRESTRLLFKIIEHQLLDEAVQSETRM